MRDLLNNIKENNFKRCYLFYGNEVYLKNLYEKKVKETLIDENFGIANFNIFEDKNVEVDKIIEYSQTLPFMAEKRLIISKNSGLFQNGRKNDSEKMALYISKIPESTVLLFIEDEIDKRGKLYKAILKEGHCIEFKHPKENDIIKWIVKKFKDNNINIENSSAVYLIRTTGGNMENISSEISKLIAFVGERGKIDKNVIDYVCVKSFETRIFDLVDAVGNMNTKIALNIYKNLILMKESPIMILSMIVRQFRIIYQCKLLLNEMKDQNLIAQKIGQREFVVRECIKQSKNFSEDILKYALSSCLDTDVAIKTGRINGELALELLIVKFGGSVNMKEESILL